MCCLTSSIKPLWGKRSVLWRETVPTLSAPMKPWSCLASPPLPCCPPPLQPPLPPAWPLKGKEKRAPSIRVIVELLLRLLPPASHCFYLISQSCCHGTEDGTSTLVLNDLLDDSLLVRHSCPVLLKCKTERNELLLLLLQEGRGAYLTILF